MGRESETSREVRLKVDPSLLVIHPPTHTHTPLKRLVPLCSREVYHVLEWLLGLWEGDRQAEVHRTMSPLVTSLARRCVPRSFYSSRISIGTERLTTYTCDPAHDSHHRQEERGSRQIGRTFTCMECLEVWRLLRW